MRTMCISQCESANYNLIIMRKAAKQPKLNYTISLPDDIIREILSYLNIVSERLFSLTPAEAREYVKDGEGLSKRTLSSSSTLT